MNSRSSVNETNLVNFPPDLSTLNQFEAKDGLLSFSFDHIYACHSEGSERRQTLQLDKEVEISTHCVVSEEEDIVASTSSEVSRLTDQLAASQNQNKRLKDLLIYHLDLIQQQNDAISKREKLFQALKQENETLKSRLNRMDRRVTLNQRNTSNPPPLVHVTGANQTAGKPEPTSSSQIMFNSLSELLIPDNRTNSFIFDSDLNKPKHYTQEPFEINPKSERDVSSFLPAELGVLSALDKSLNCQDYTMVEAKSPFVKKDVKNENRPDALYTVSGNSANPVIQRIQRSRRRTTSGTGSLSRASKSSSIKVEVPVTSNPYEEDKHFDRNYTVNKKSKMINTYGKCARNGNQKKTLHFTGSLSDRLQLIDTTPTGEDPYQLGEADMREQSPIPKLMLQKNNQGRVKICSTDTNSTSPSRHLYDSSSIDENSDNCINKIKLNRYNLTNTYMHHSEIKKEDPDSMLDEPDLDLVKTEAEIDWRIYSAKSETETSLGDFSYGENPNNILPVLGTVEFQDLFTSDSNLYQSDSMNQEEYNSSNDKSSTDKSTRRVGRTSSLMISSHMMDDDVDTKSDKRGRKRALSTTGLLKTLKKENAQKGGISKPKLVKGKTIFRGKKSPMPGIMTQRPYHTLVGDPDVSWYLGLDPDIKSEDVDQPGGATIESTVEVPRWREKPYTSCYTLEGTENLDDKIFEKRHQKLEAEERRQLRWHMRRIREQRHVERLRQRQRDSWCAGGGSPRPAPSSFTVWPQPQRDVRFIEITDSLPVTAFGEALPAMPETDFVLPWVMSSKAMKRSKRSKTLH